MLYQKLYDYLCDQIKQQHYLAGDKLPSIRQLAQLHQVSVSTVIRALEELEDRGLIEARYKSGFYVKAEEFRPELPAKSQPLVSLKPSLSKDVKIHQLASEIFHQCGAPNVVNLGTSYPDPSFYPQKELQRIGTRLLKQKMDDILQVHFTSGYLPLRQVLAKRMNRSGCHISHDDIIVTNGCLEALSLCLKAVAKKGDTIAIESPGFIGLLQLIESLGLKALEIPCLNDQGLSLQALELALEQWDIKALALVPSFSNPSGSLMPESNRKQLVEMLAQKNIPLIEDELIADLAFDGALIKPCKAFDQKGLVMYCSSVSKTMASGLRVGWISPGVFAKEIAYFKTFTNISASNFSQMLVAECLSSGLYDKHLRQLTKKLAKQVHYFQRLIKQYFPEETEVTQPKGGSVLWLKLPSNILSFSFYQKALALGVALIPGKLMTATQKFDQHIRINCACNPDIDVEYWLQQLGQLAFDMQNETH
jgi:DNA-binding transcriptional MocR family regulator